MKAVKAIAAADVLLVDDLVSREMLRMRGPATHRPRRQARRLPSTPQAFIERLMVAEARTARAWCA